MRLALILLLACLAGASSANPPQPRATAERAEGANQIANPAPRGGPVPVRVVNQPPDPAGYQDPCQYNESDSRSDLCAQWTAARGASDAAYYARLQLWGAGVGIIGLFGTIWLTLWAVRAAGRSADAANEANRPWLELRAHIPNGCIWAGKNGASTDVQFNLMNRGNSPATDVALVVEMVPLPAGFFPKEDPALVKMREKLRLLDEGRPRVGSAIFPGAKVEYTLATEVSGEEVAAALPHPHGQLRYLIAVGTSYMFGKRECHTVKVYDLFIQESVEYSVHDLLQRVKLKPGDWTDTFRGYAS